MATKTDKTIDISKIVGNLNKMAETPSPNQTRTVKDIIAEEPLWSAITAAHDQGYSWDEIAEAIKSGDLVIKPSTLQSYYRTIAKEKGGDTGAKANAKSKANAKKNVTAKPSEAGSEKPADAKPDNGASAAGTGSTGTAKTETKPDAKPEGKTLTKQPSMGGAFNSDDL